MPHESHDHDTHHHHHPRRRFTAIVDHLANEYTAGARLRVLLDPAVMHANGLAIDDWTGSLGSRSITTAVSEQPPDRFVIPDKIVGDR